MTLVVFSLGTLLLLVAKWRGDHLERERHLQILQADAIEMVGRLAGMSQHLLRQKHRRGVELEMSYASLHPDLKVGVVLGPDNRVLQATQLALRDQPLDSTELIAFSEVVKRARTNSDLAIDSQTEVGVLLVASPFYPKYSADELGVVALRFDANRRRLAALQESRRALLVQAGVLAACCLLLWAAMDALLSGRLRSVLRMACDFGAGGDVNPPLEGDDELSQISRSFHGAIQKAREVESQLVDATEAERQRIGRDIHDDVCQRIAGVQLRAGVLHSTLNRESHAQAELAASIAYELGRAADIARGLSRGMTPIVTEYAELVDMLNALSLEVRRSFGPDVGVDAENLPEVFDASQWTYIYRVIQELTTNAAKHGRATTIDIRVRATKEFLIIEVESNGLPFDGHPTGPRGVGFQFAQQRIRALSGRLQFIPKREGTLAICEIPFGITINGTISDS